jgi:hypothetical protein
MNGTALPGGRSHLLTGEHARGQRKKNSDPSLIEPISVQ